MGTSFQSKVVEKQTNHKGCIGVGQPPVEQRALVTDESNEERFGQLECPHNEHNPGYASWRSTCGGDGFAVRLAHRWATHTARFSEDHWLAMTLRTRSVQLWRWRPCRHKAKRTSTGLFRYPFTYDRPGVPLRSTLRALLYFTCGPPNCCRRQ